MSGWMFLLLAILSSAAMTLVLKAFKTEGTNRYAIILGNYITCVIVGFFLLPDRSVILQARSLTLLCGVIGGALFVLSLVLMQLSIGTNGAILTAAFSRLGLVVPLLVSIFLFAENPAPLQIIGLVLVLVAMWVINGKDESSKTVRPLLLIFVLLGGGLSDTMAKIFSYYGNQAQDSLYIFIVFLTATIVTTGLLLLEGKKTGRYGTWKDYLAGIAVGIPNYFSASFLLKSLNQIPAYIAYTVFSTGVLLLITILSMLLFREKPGKRQMAGLGIIIAALVLLNI